MEVKLIYGPPGTGKTTKLLSILEEELKLVEPDEIAFVSFTKKGTYEGKSKAKEQFKLTNDDIPYFRTIHSLAFRSAGLNRSDMISKNHYRQFSDATGMRFSGYYTEDLRHDDDRYLFFHTLYRNNPKAADALLKDLNPKLLEWLIKEFKRYKDFMGLFDFTDIIEMFLLEGKTLPVKVAIIDEAQDLTTLQWRFIWKAFRYCSRVYIAGDDDQAIYEWSGADVNYFLGIKGHAEVLDKSWRLPSAVHDYAIGISSMINTRIDKQFQPNRIGGEVNILNDFKELSIDNQSTWMILARNRRHLKEVESWLKSHGLVYRFKDDLSYSKDIVRGIRAHHAIKHGHPVMEGERMTCTQLMSPENKIPFTKPWYEEFTVMQKEDLDYYRNIIGNKTDLAEDYITVSTIHGVKGGQADNVVLLLDYNKTVEKNYGTNPDSEMRCYYVAVTRAKNKLYLVLPQGKFGYKYLRSDNE